MTEGIRRYSISDVRKLCHKTQAEWAEMLGVSTSTVINWEAGRSEPKLSHLRKMSVESNISLDFIFLGYEP